MRSLLLLLMVYTTTLTFGQRCGEGIFTFEIINPDKENITVTVYPLDNTYAKEFKNRYCSGGCELSEEEGKKWRSIIHTQRSNQRNGFFPLYEETAVKKNKVDFVTYEMAFEPRVILFEGEKTGKRLFLTANIHGGCDYSRTIKWNVEQPLLVPYGQ
ncbi:MAG: succinylglutamate desuccinylase/aspartoacylase family protein [Bacteroidetes bacterium]|nr:succinylglutamate desuccinylase/aspartoacylase family protein [Bacteroidota bacterium]